MNELAIIRLPILRGRLFFVVSLEPARVSCIAVIRKRRINTILVERERLC